MEGRVGQRCLSQHMWLKTWMRMWKPCCQTYMSRLLYSAPQWLVLETRPLLLWLPTLEPIWRTKQRNKRRKILQMGWTEEVTRKQIRMYHKVYVTMTHNVAIHCLYIGTIVGRVALFHLYTLRINCTRTLYPTCNWCSPLNNSQHGQLEKKMISPCEKISRIEACTCWGDGAMDLTRVIAIGSKYRENLQNYTLPVLIFSSPTYEHAKLDFIRWKTI